MSDIKKVLVFEGCGMDYASSKSDIGNYRIRSTFKNDKGRIIYLEAGGHENTGYLPDYNRNFVFPLHISHCFDVRYIKTNSDPRLKRVEKFRGEYTKKRLLEIINNNLGCSFDDIEVDNKANGFELKATFNSDYNGCFKEFAGKEITLCDFIPCDELDSEYWVKVKEIEESHLIKSKHFVGLK